MRLAGIIAKSLKEQLRSFWVLLLTLLMGPFFIMVYFLIMESSRLEYRVLLVNGDAGSLLNGQPVNEGRLLISALRENQSDTGTIPASVSEAASREKGIAMIRDNKADILVVIGKDFSGAIQARRLQQGGTPPGVELVGDLSRPGYVIAAVWAGDRIGNWVARETGTEREIRVTETPLGRSAAADGFDMIVPGILILSLIMLMFTASIAFVAEVENRTILLLRLSGMRTLEFVTGTGLVQVLVGLVSVLLTLATALLLGFHYSGSLAILCLVAGLTAISIIAFSVIIAGITKSATEVLVVGNFPMFLFMFFTGAAFPMQGAPLFSICGYAVTIQGLMSPTHAISALNKTLILDMGLKDILPEICAIIILTLIYFIAGALIFKHRHLKKL